MSASQTLKAKAVSAVNSYMRLRAKTLLGLDEVWSCTTLASPWRRLQLNSFTFWLAQPVKPDDLQICDQLQQTLVGRTSMLLFGGSGVLSMAAAYTVLQNARVGLILCLLSIASTILRVLSAQPASQALERVGPNCRAIVTVGLFWTTITSVVNVLCVVTGKPLLIALASCVSTGLAFGAAFNNSAAPRFARTQLLVMILPYIAAIASIPAPHMRWMLAVAPLWVGGTFLVVDRSYRDRADLIHAQQRATFLALNDQLTGLANRAQIMNMLQQCCETIHAGEGRTTYVLFLDLDGFKMVNDSYGHGTGDELLCAVASRLTEAIRPNDMMGRFGGDEFVAILQGITAQQVREVANSMVTRVGEPFNLATASDVHIGVSIGGTSLATRDARSVLARADALLYAAKRAGKGTVRLSQALSGEKQISSDSDHYASLLPTANA